jgi:hypothetical protein
VCADEDPSEAGKAMRKAEKDRKRLLNSEIMNELRSEYTDRCEPNPTNQTKLSTPTQPNPAQSSPNPYFSVGH